MKISITIKLDNAAFDETGGAAELTRILQELSVRIANSRSGPGDRVPLRDLNGNTVGYCHMKITNERRVMDAEKLLAHAEGR